MLLVLIGVFSSVQFSHSVMSNFLWPHGLQHARPPWPSLTPGAYSNSCPLSQWCHPTISSSVVPFSSCLQSFPASGSFRMSQFWGVPHNETGVLTSLNKHELWRIIRRNSRIYPRFPPQLEKNHETSPSPQDEHQVAKVLEFQLQHQSFQWIFRTDFL